MALLRGRHDRLSHGSCRAVGTLFCFLVIQGAGAERLRGQARQGRASVVGEIVEYETGRVLEGATVLLLAPAGGRARSEAARSDSAGTFRFPDLVPGDYFITVALLGFGTVTDTLEIARDSDVELLVPLSIAPITLEPIVVQVSSRPIGPLREFERRRRSTNGTFFTREDIEEAHVAEFTDLVRTLGGVRLVSAGAFRTRLVFRGGCSPDFWLDGIPVPGGTLDLDSYVHPQDLEAVEIYRGADVPVQFGVNVCAVIVAWTRRGDPSIEPRSFWKQVITAGAIVLGFVLIHR